MTLKNSKIIALFIVLVGILLILFCNQIIKQKNFDFSGVWSNSDGAILELQKDGSFSASNLPKWFFDLGSTSSEKINGSGFWSYQSQFIDRDIVLNYKIYSGDKTNKGYRYVLKVSNGSSPYLYTWEGEEGDTPKYKFEK